MITAKEAREKTRQAVEKKYSVLISLFKDKLSYVEEEINKAAASRKVSTTVQVALPENDIEDFLYCIKHFGYSIDTVNFKGDLYTVIRRYDDYKMGGPACTIEFTIKW